MARYDIHIQPLPQAEVQGWKTISFAHKPRLKIDGPQLVLNRFLKELLTPAGSDPLDLASGTMMAELAGGGNVEEQTLRDLVNLSMIRATENLQRYDADTLPPAREKFGGASLVRFRQLGRDGFEAWIQVRNVAGEIIQTLISGTPTTTV
jgi:hypothetical protein